MNEIPLELTSVLQAAVESLRPLADERGVRLTAALEALRCNGRGAALEPLMRRLVTRAIELTSRGGEVHVSLGRAGSLAVVSVTDTGAPLPPEDLAHARRVVEDLGGAVEAFG